MKKILVVGASGQIGSELVKPLSTTLNLIYRISTVSPMQQGGCIITVADDPSMHSSQDEQDSRILADFALLPILEPSNQQEAYDMVFYGYDISEKYKTPVFMRLTTRLSHSRANVETREPRPQNEIRLPEDKRQFVLLPAIAKKRYKRTLANQQLLLEESEKAPWNKYIDAPDKSLGIIACGLAYNYLMENFDGKPPYQQAHRSSAL